MRKNNKSRIITRPEIIVTANKKKLRFVRTLEKILFKNKYVSFVCRLTAQFMSTGL